ncbi:hypothetical protein [Pseudovibrio sp. Alg231-02]|uniref:hypothetical protein n=1 Tax=Pseudovibrio sp. Alg231-02 TaxID=1922223 RepID=UPI00131F2661|nr:hypothetical protein [Pseudovibrio sp. Alg231-02]
MESKNGQLDQIKKVAFCYLLPIISSGSNHLWQAFQILHGLKIPRPLNLHNRKKLKDLLLLAMKRRRVNASSVAQHFSGEIQRKARVLDRGDDQVNLQPVMAMSADEKIQLSFNNLCDADDR